MYGFSGNEKRVQIKKMEKAKSIEEWNMFL